MSESELKPGMFTGERKRQDPTSDEDEKKRMSFAVDAAIAEGLQEIADNLAAQGVVTEDGRKMNKHALGVQVLTDFVRGVQEGRREIEVKERTVSTVKLSGEGGES